MKAVLGFLFLLGGFTVGWLVISGKLPNTTPVAAPAATTPSASDPASAGKAPTSNPGGSNIKGGPMGDNPFALPTMAHMDVTASRGGMQ